MFRRSKKTGYGHIAPTTDPGKIKVLIYTIIGLPVMMLFLANIGGLLGRVLKYIYSRMCCRYDIKY